jgi:hypothetical protein
MSSSLFMGDPPETLDKIGQYKNKVKKSRNCMTGRICAKMHKKILGSDGE